MRLGTRSRQEPADAARLRALTYRIAALVLDHPDEELLGRLPALREAAGGLPAPARDQLGRLIEHLGGRPELQLAAEYVTTFDLRRRCCLYLTYYAYGDTRKRGVALLTMKQAYRRSGVELTAQELPDHLCVLLEFTATADARAGIRLLEQHRAGLELLRLALTDAGSPYADGVAAVCGTLVPLAGPDRQAVARLAAAGPPGEDVGLEPYSEPFVPPEYLGAPR